jgi:hypothetical protein
MDMQGNFIAEFVSISEAAKANGITNCNFTGVLRGDYGRRTIAGCRWKLKEKN